MNPFILSYQELKLVKYDYLYMLILMDYLKQATHLNSLFFNIPNL